MLFRHQPDYVKRTELADSAGVYSLEAAASFFFLTGEGDDFNTLVHEMTHQMNDKILLAWGLPPWFEEGIAEFKTRFAELCQRNRVERVLIDTSRDLGEVLVDYLNQRSIRNRSR